MPTIRLTQLAVDKLAPPKTGRVVHWDRTLPGFGLRMTATGAKSGLPCTGSAASGIGTIGPLARIPKVDDARKLARESMAKAAAGENPVARAEGAGTQGCRDYLPAVAERYVERYAKKHTKPTTWKELQRQLDVDVFPHWAIGKCLDHAPGCCRPAGRHRAPRFAGSGEPDSRAAEDAVRLGSARGNHSRTTQPRASTRL